jgi:hypothetical protein
MRAIVEFDGEQYVSRFAIAQDEVEMLPGNHVAEASIPIGVVAGKEIGKSNFECQYKCAGDRCAK